MTSRWAVIAALSVLPGVLSADDLGAAAHKEKERRDRNRDAGVKARVITSQEVRTAPPEATPSPAAAGSSRRGPGGRNGEPTGSTVDDTEVRKARGAALRPQLQAAERAVKSAEENVARVQAQIDALNRTPIGGYTSGDGGRAALRSNLEGAQAALRSAKEHRDSIEDTARREGIPPDYLR